MNLIKGGVVIRDVGVFLDQLTPPVQRPTRSFGSHSRTLPLYESKLRPRKRSSSRAWLPLDAASFPLALYQRQIILRRSVGSPAWLPLDSLPAAPVALADSKQRRSLSYRARPVASLFVGPPLSRRCAR